MPCLVIVHARGNSTWDTDDVVQVFHAQRRDGKIVAWIGNVWMTDLGRLGSKEFLALWIPNLSVEQARPFEGLGKGRVDWRPHFSAQEQSDILDNTKTIPFQEKPGIAKDILKPGPR